MIEYFLPDDVARCDKDSCPSHLFCARYLDCLPWETYSYSEFDEKDCEYFIENEPKNEK